MARPRVFVLAIVSVVAASAAVGLPVAQARSRHANERTGKLMPAFAELVKARKRGDRSALGRLGDRIGPARLAAAITGADERVAEAALAAAPLARGGVLLVGAIADQLRASDPARAAAAAAALGSLLDGAVPTALEDWDVPPDLVAHACEGLQTLAARKEAPLPARLAALDALQEAAPSCASGADLASLAHDPAGDIRRAAALVAAAGRGRAALLRGRDRRRRPQRERGGGRGRLPRRGARRSRRQGDGAGRIRDRCGAGDGAGAVDTAGRCGRDARLPGGGQNARRPRLA